MTTPDLDTLAADVAKIKSRLSPVDREPNPPPPLTEFSKSLTARDEAARQRRLKAAEIDAERRAAAYEKDRPRREKIEKKIAGVRKQMLDADEAHRLRVQELATEMLSLQGSL